MRSRSDRSKNETVASEISKKLWLAKQSSVCSSINVSTLLTSSFCWLSTAESMMAQAVSVVMLSAINFEVMRRSPSSPYSFAAASTCGASSYVRVQQFVYMKSAEICG